MYIGEGQNNMNMMFFLFLPLSVYEINCGGAFPKFYHVWNKII